MNPEKPNFHEVRFDTVLPCRDNHDNPLCQYTVTHDYQTNRLIVELHTLSGATTPHQFVTETRDRSVIEQTINQYLQGQSLP